MRLLISFVCFLFVTAFKPPFFSFYQNKVMDRSILIGYKKECDVLLLE